MAPCRGLRRLVHLALFLWFLVQCAISVSKIIKGNVGTSEWTDHEEIVQYPSVTMCPMPSWWERRNATNGPSDFPPIETELVELIQGPFTEG